MLTIPTICHYYLLAPRVKEKTPVPEPDQDDDEELKQDAAATADENDDENDESDKLEQDTIDRQLEPDVNDDGLEPDVNDGLEQVNNERNQGSAEPQQNMASSSLPLNGVF